MSENLDLVRSIYAASEQGFTSPDWADPEIEYSVIGGPSPGSGRGLASMARAMVDYVGPWKGYQLRSINTARSTRSECLCSSGRAAVAGPAGWTSRR